MLLQDAVAKLSNGAEITYLDTGAPEGVTDYRTFIFVHGTAHNKCTLLPLILVSEFLLIVDTFEPTLRATPKGLRGISLSLRGYKGSTALTEDEAKCRVTPSQLHKTHIDDFAHFVQFVASDLGVPKRSNNGTGGITTIHWSKGAAVATGLFYFQNPLYKKIVDEYISSLVLYELPTSAVVGITAGDCATALFWSRLAAPPEDPPTMFSKYVAGFYHNAPEYLAGKQIGGKQCIEYYRTGALEPEFVGYRDKIYDGTYLESIFHWFLADNEEDRMEACHQAFKNMAHSSVKRIGLLWGSEGPPECLEGSWIAEKWLEEEEAKGAEKKLVTKQFEGGNHYLQFYQPAGFWDAILELSV